MAHTLTDSELKLLRGSIPQSPKPMGLDSLPDPIAVTIEVTGILERLGVRYLIGGWLASTVSKCH